MTPEERRATRRSWYHERGGKAKVRAAERKWLASDGGRAHRQRQCQKARAEAWHYRQHYGLTLLQWHEMLIAQAGRCDCCGKPMRKVCVDHHHATGKVRGLVCQRCNIAVAHAEDTDLMWKAVAYLHRWSN